MTNKDLKEPCCALRKEFESNNITVYESDNFFVMPTLGSMGIEGYLLICSKEHFIGVGGMPEKYHRELEEVLDLTRRVVSETYKSDVVVFEHGPRVGCFRGGGCLDHTHLHIMPVAFNLMEPVALRFLNALSIKDYYKIERISGFGKISDIFEKQQSSYLFVEMPDRKRYTTEVNFALPSQYLRQVIAHGLGKKDSWNWKENPDYETIQKTLDRLKGKF
ncbi:hypothetical protein JW756_01940 [Candidatus Woesearchaeota archaeon]|nr:hypothetical protein [Candidatus Woesearchaeota archaeon]